jgi:serine/threonine protein kinase
MKMLIYNPDERHTASQILKHQFFKELREQDQQAHHHMSQITAGPQGFTKSVSSSNHMLQAATAVDNLSQYSRRNSDNVSETGGDQSFHSKSFNKKGKKNGGGVDKKKVLPNKKFPELKLMISGEGRNSNNTFSSDEEAGIGNVSKIYFLN